MTQFKCTKNYFRDSAEGIAYIWYVYWYGIVSPVLPTYAHSCQDRIEFVKRKIFKTYKYFKIVHDDPNETIEVGFQNDDLLNTPISLHRDPSNNRLLDFFKCVCDNLAAALHRANTEINAREPIIQAIHVNNENPPREVNRERLADIVPLFMEKLCDDIPVLAPYDYDFTPDGDGKAFDNRALARARFKVLCDGLPLPPAKASFQNTKLHTLDS